MEILDFITTCHALAESLKSLRNLFPTIYSTKETSNGTLEKVSVLNFQYNPGEIRQAFKTARDNKTDDIIHYYEMCACNFPLWQTAIGVNIMSFCRHRALPYVLLCNTVVIL